MTDLNEILQQRLTLLEQGSSIEQVLAGLPSEAAELAPLLTLAAAARTTAHPTLPAQVAQAQHARVVQAAQAARPTARAPRFSPQLWAGGLAVLVVVLLATLAISLAWPGAASAQASLTDLNGLVEVAPNAASTDWHFVVAGETLRQGQRVRTYADSSVTLVFADGTRTQVGAGADLTLTTLAAAGAGVLQAQITQNSGETSYSVIPFRSDQSFFEVFTPAGLVQVHGTEFNVAVTPLGEVLFAVTRGKVQISQVGEHIFLASGQATAGSPGETLDEPGYQFNLQGGITRILGDQWSINGVPFSVTPQTEVLGSFKVGDWARVRGRVLNSGQWVADRIEPARKEDTKLHFTGIIESISSVPGAWVISGQTVQVTAQTELSQNLKVGTPVEVAFVLQADGSWLAREIDALEEEPQLTATPYTRTPSLTVSVTATPTPTFTITPTVTGTRASPTATITGTRASPTATLTPTATVMPKNDSSRCDNRDQPQPDGLRLAQRYGVSYDEIILWFCKGFGFGEIDLAYGLALDTGKPVSTIFALRSSGAGWGEIKKSLSPQITPAATRPGNNDNPKPQKTPKK